MRSRQPTLTRRRFLQLGAGLAAMALLQACTTPEFMVPVAMPIDAPLPSNADRAATAYGAQQARLWRGQAVKNDTNGLYLEQAPAGLTGPAYAYLWPLSQALAADMDVLLLPWASADDRAITQRLMGEGLRRYWDGKAYQSAIMPPRGLGGDRYYDDNAWIGLDLVRAYRMLGDKSTLDYAAEVFAYLVSGWDNDQNDVSPGGIFWVQADWNRDRTTASNAPTVELGLRLYQITGQDYYLTWARRIYDWLNAALLSPEGLYYDKINRAGAVDNGRSAANQGTMIGAHVLFYEITHDRAYVQRANDILQTALELYAQVGLSEQRPFNAILLRNLLYLSRVDATHLERGRRALQDYADQAWRNNRTLANLFAFPPTAGFTNLVDQSALVQIQALLACPPEKYNQLL